MLENFKFHNESFIMPTDAFDPFRESWFECSSCREPLFEKCFVSDIPRSCPHCGVALNKIICDKEAFHMFYKMGEIVDSNKSTK